jgi:protein-tyrosine phosphatase
MFRQVNLPKGIPGMLLLHSMPGRYESLGQFTSEIKRLGVGRIICLAPLDEIRKKSGQYFQAIRVGELPCNREAFEVQDFQAPDDREGFVKLVKDVASRLGAGEHILVHCAGGVGRTGTFAACVLVSLGIGLDEALTTISQSGSQPETASQVAFVRWAADRLHCAAEFGGH